MNSPTASDLIIVGSDVDNLGIADLRDGFTLDVTLNDIEAPFLGYYDVLLADQILIDEDTFTLERPQPVADPRPQRWRPGAASRRPRTGQPRACGPSSPSPSPPPTASAAEGSRLAVLVPSSTAPGAWLSGQGFLDIIRTFAAAANASRSGTWRLGLVWLVVE